MKTVLGGLLPGGKIRDGIKPNKTSDLLPQKRTGVGVIAGQIFKFFFPIEQTWRRRFKLKKLLNFLDVTSYEYFYYVFDVVLL